MADTALCYLQAAQARALFEARALSPVEVAQAVIAQAERQQDTVNAYAHFDPQGALEQARTAERRYMGEGDAPRPLEGIPTALKDAGSYPGWPTTYGSLTADTAPRSIISPENATMVRAGATLLGSTRTPEFSGALVTHSRAGGVTRNPHNLDLTPGGSSGGAAAAVAMGAATLAVGSDIGGSIRTPASCCGVVGYKPPKGRNPVSPPFNLDFYCHTGPIARTVADTVLMQNSMCGPHPGDSTLISPRLILAADIKPLAGVRVAFSMDLGFFAIDPEVAANTRAALEVLRAAGATVTEVSIPWDASIIDAAKAHLSHIFSSWMAEESRGKEDLLSPYTETWLAQGANARASDYYAALGVAGAMGQSFAGAMEDHDILICPTTALPAVPADFDPSRDTLTIDGSPVDPVLGWALTVPFNMLSTLPVLSVPSGTARNACPTGIQIVGKPFQDQSVFDVALAYEAEVGGFETLVGRPDEVTQTGYAKTG